jgi:diguanylate cyclase (GGDEF)-like protein
MYELSRRDSLTHVYNRRGFLDSANSAINITKRNNKYWGVMIFDVDRFKAVNDNFGHDAGDAVLKAIAELIGKNIRVGDILGRWGGEEFVVFLYGGDINGSELLAERLRSEIQQNIILPDSTSVTISIGVASGGLDIRLQTAISKADECLYRAKQMGRNRVCIEAPV